MRKQSKGLPEKDMSEEFNLLGKSSHPIYIQVRDLILQKILLKQWTAGQKLPSDREMSAMLGINHITLGKALNMLRDEGYLTRYPGHGTYVNEMLKKSDNRRKTIALVFDDAGEKTFMTDLFVAFCSSLDNAGLTMKFFSSRGNPDFQYYQMLEIADDPGIDGCIIWSIMKEEHTGIFLKRKREDFPVVFMDHYPYDFQADWSGYDDYSAGWMLGDHLKQEGISYGYVVLPERSKDMSTVCRRINGLQAALDNHLQKICYPAGNIANWDGRLVTKVLSGTGGNYGRQALIAISDMDAVFFQELLKGNPALQKNFKLCTFLTGCQSDIMAMKMPVKEMAANAVDIIKSRLDGNKNSQITREVPGKLEIPPERQERNVERETALAVAR